MRSYSSREVIRILEQNGWYFVGQEGSHHHFRHPDSPNKIQVPHPRKDLKTNIVKALAKQTGIKF